MMKFKEYEFRPCIGAKGEIQKNRYELVKWENGFSYCYTIAFLTYNPEEGEWESDGVGLRIFRDFTPGLGEYVFACCGLVEICTSEKEDF